ncbi:hypothetical protein PTTG_05337 [Puccinia triticina 1-1 BBBD Race 1]|uniref:Uncharacterized protein n=1 Tax=Puccinia triticina (isolate 1-1 / race 1 (BBBD)) TaxID=630390 RepID=A0A0C4EWZ0_PUCT1|nr:hypothetical protein PTTG_05337 [Puccinia triticina 1-1 BBBD Race 1]
MLHKTWSVVKEDLFDAALPSQWLTDLERQIRYIKMGDAETFSQYTTWARTLQRLINFDGELLSDFKLAEGMTFGLPPELEHEVNKLALFISPETGRLQVQRIRQEGGELLRRPPKTNHPTLHGTAIHNKTSRINYRYRPAGRIIWHIHAYLDLLDKCHHCKQHCGFAAGTCPGPAYRGPIDIFSSFTVPPKPADYVAPQAWTKTQAASNRPSVGQPGRPTGKPAGIAALEEDKTDGDDYEESYTAAVSSLAQIKDALATQLAASPGPNPTPNVPPLPTSSTLAAAHPTISVAMAEILDIKRRFLLAGEAAAGAVPTFNTNILNSVESGCPEDQSSDEGSME